MYTHKTSDKKIIYGQVDFYAVSHRPAILIIYLLIVENIRFAVRSVIKHYIKIYIINYYMYYVHVNRQKVFDWTQRTKSLILSAFFWGYLIMNLPAAMIGRRYNNQMLLAMSMTLTVVLSLITPSLVVAFDWPVLVLIRFLQGLTQVRTIYYTILIDVLCVYLLKKKKHPEKFAI